MLIKNSYDKEFLTFSEKVYLALEKLRKFNEDYIYTNPRINTEMEKIENMYRQLFARYRRALGSKSRNSYIMQFLRSMDSNYRKNTIPMQQIIDCIAGMTDDFFYNQYQKNFVPLSYGYELKKLD